MYLHVHMYQYIYIYMLHVYTYIHTYMHACIHIYIYRQIHTYLNVINIWLTNDIYIMISWCSSPQQPRAWTFVQNWHKCSTAPKASKSFERSSKNCGPNWRKSARAGSVCWGCCVCHLKNGEFSRGVYILYIYVINTLISPTGIDGSD